MNYTGGQCCYFPTTGLFLDDNENFLSNLRIKIKPQTPYFLYSDQKKALKKIQESANKIISFQKFMVNGSNDEDDKSVETQQSVDVRLSEIHEEIYNGDRFSLISTVIIDYHLDGESGVEFCRKIKGLPCKKIILTGEAGFDVAVSAFNEGIIDKFILKNSETVFEEIHQAINEGERDYFKTNFGYLDSFVSRRIPIIADAKFIELFNQIVQDNKIVEYYLLDASGSYLFVDQFGDTSVFILKSGEEMAEYFQIAKEIHAEAKIVEALQEKRQIPFFFTEKDKKAPASQWQNYLYLANTFESKANGEYVYSVVPYAKMKNADWLKKDKIRSFSEYLKSKKHQLNEN